MNMLGIIIKVRETYPACICYELAMSANIRVIKYLIPDLKKTLICQKRT